MNTYEFGPRITNDGILFRFWAPKQMAVKIKIDQQPPAPMERQDDGWHVLKSRSARPGSRYAFILEDGMTVPDPGSRYQPDDVHGSSMVVDPDSHVWRTPDWTGRPWHETVLYELHVGTFTREGTFIAAIDKLDHLVALGVTAIELMPIADFPGRYGWGYDGVLHYAPDSSYGRPDDLKRLVDAAHARGLSVFLDVVYNHFGPDGNYMAVYAPLFTEKHHTPWGAGINFDDEGSRTVRTYMVENALYWIREFHLDGLRLDAVHSIEDTSTEHLLHEIARRVKEEARGRHVHLVAENEHNDSTLLERGPDGSPSRFTAQWNDDIHHALHVMSTGETIGYYADYDDLPGMLGKSLSEGFIYQGQDMPYRGSPRGTPSTHLPPTAFVSFIQNHDQIGNRAFGDRLPDYSDPAALRAITAIYLLSPQIPMLFMGEEWQARTPFPYFCDFGEELNAKVREGRRKEMSRLPGFEPEHKDRIPDPTRKETFLSAKLDWSGCENGGGRAHLEFYRTLLGIRKERIVPLLSNPGSCQSEYKVEGTVLEVEWRIGDQVLAMTANLSGDPASHARSRTAPVLWESTQDEQGRLSPWSEVFSLAPAG